MGMAVQVVWDDVSDQGVAVPRFRPATR
jgi:hypothetical protein